MESCICTLLNLTFALCIYCCIAFKLQRQIFFTFIIYLNNHFQTAILYIPTWLNTQGVLYMHPSIITFCTLWRRIYKFTEAFLNISIYRSLHVWGKHLNRNTTTWAPEKRIRCKSKAPEKEDKVEGCEVWFQNKNKKRGIQMETQKEEEISSTSKTKGKSGIWMIFMCADAVDVWLMTFGIVGAIGSGFSYAFMFLVSSKIMNNMGNGHSSGSLLIHDINKVMDHCLSSFPMSACTPCMCTCACAYMRAHVHVWE